LNPHQVVVDIGALRQILRSVLEQLEYRNLDEHPAFAARMSTTERVAEHVANAAAERLSALAPDAAPAGGASLRVVVRESPVAYAAYDRAL
jgi:6-pyruvoyltetrahydropterin/6-carboxytetrahydropterin synthase